MATIELTQRVTLSSDVLFQEVGGEVVLLDLASESYFGLDAVGSRIWTLLAKDSSLASVHRTMIEEFDVEPSVLEGDLLYLVGKLQAAGLVRIE